LANGNAGIKGRTKLPYATMSIDEIEQMPVQALADTGAHLWLWTTNSFLHSAFHVMAAWGFTFLSPITWVKPSGFGCYFVNTTQHCLFGYYKTCRFPQARYLLTHFEANPTEHSAKPAAFYDIVRKVSPGPRIDLFNRREIPDFEGWGNEVPPPQLKLWDSAK